MCHQFIPIICHRRRPQHTPRKVRNLDNLCSLNVASADSFSSSIGLWNCQSAVNKADFIPAFATHYNLSVLALTETWIHAENTATLAALASNFNFYHTSRPNRRGGGTGLLLSKTWKFTCLSPSCSYTSFEFHSVTVTDPAKMHFLVIYRPPGQLGKFIDEFDMLLSTIPNDGTPLLVLGDFNIHLDKPHAAYFLALLPTVDLKQFTTPAIPKADKQLNLTLTQQSPGHQAVWLQEQSLHRDCSAFRH
ncbi:uncharacterized protein LOC108275562 isoform X1 [Ictalurus punctatus]|uniref:Uncharacterized protein LOC108275562 isoform X1 n=1 Tax=Ictalurus punctatus TaxID=7998 RepID=A0A9F7RMS4_ICTPU|nr:uncharacterized protein LOC108275562 isoform X1 [Ictalurus punctatus]XP_053543307.1 uncharacterized protein LOC108275562 isoform X1 [Ictalurus punctatus]